MNVLADKLRSSFEDVLRDKKTLLKIMSIAVILLLALILKTSNSDSEQITIEADAAGSEQTETVSDELCVDISGAVEAPGVYKVASGTRLYEVVEMAGGLRSDADINSVNQASFVEDGAKIIIPVANGDNENPDAEAAEVLADTDAQAASSGDIVNINTASKDQLTSLNGIGDVIAERIIEYRTTTPFKKKEDIMSVKGIGSATYEKIQSDITV